MILCIVVATYLLCVLISFLVEVFVGWMPEHSDNDDIAVLSIFWFFSVPARIINFLYKTRDKRIEKDNKKRKMRISIEKEMEKYQAQAELEVEEMVRKEFKKE